MQKILIPTDFQMSSLFMLKTILSEKKENESLECTFVVGHYLSDSITSLLFYDPKKIVEQFMHPGFLEGLEIVLNKHSNKQIQIKYDVFTGLTHNSFKNFIRAKAFDCAYIIDNYKMKFGKSSGMDFSKFLFKQPSLLNVQKVALKPSSFDVGITGIFTS